MRSARRRKREERLRRGWRWEMEGMGWEYWVWGMVTSWIRVRREAIKRRRVVMRRARK